MSWLATRVKRFAIFIHRWMGVAFCLLFAWWFISGIFMMYSDFPAVSAKQRLGRSGAINPAEISVTPEDAYERLKADRPPSQTVLGVLEHRPVYRFRIGSKQTLVYADTGRPLLRVPADAALRIGSGWTGQPANTARAEVNIEEDQWTVPGQYRALRPLLKYSWPDGQQVYVSLVTGEVAQHTTTKSRILAHLGPIPHWLYYTPLRKDGALWSQVVIWLSGLATIAALLGMVVGIWMYSPSKRYRFENEASRIPYTGQKRLHMIVGLCFGVIACTWAFSGMLSMDPFPLPQGLEDNSANIASALRDSHVSLEDFAAKPAAEVIGELGPDFAAKELEYTSYAGKPAYFVTGAKGETRIVPVQGEVMAELDRNRIFKTITAAVVPLKIIEFRTVTEYEAYYIDRQHLRPLPVLFVRLNDPGRSMFYIDPKSARIVGSYDNLSRWDRWLYHGLHSLDFPWLYRHRPLWDIVVLLLMAGGVALCVTSVILGTQVLTRMKRRVS